MSVTRAQVDAICGSLAGAELALPPELLSWKVGGKMFACFGGERDIEGISVKCADIETAQMVIEAGEAVRAPYFHKSWVRLQFSDADLDDVKIRLLASYEIVRSSLPKALRDDLSARKEV